jgi:hypothetical protein
MGSPKNWGRGDNSVAHEHRCAGLLDARVASEWSTCAEWVDWTRGTGQRCKWNGQSEMVGATYALGVVQSPNIK